MPNLFVVPNNLNNLNNVSGYRFTDLPERSLLYQVRIAINNSGLDSWSIANRCNEYITERAIANLMNGKTKSPHLRTVRLVMKALGYELIWRKKEGN